jgi:DNA-binding response OmpR family regulator
MGGIMDTHDPRAIRVLVVDDDASFTAATERALTAAGCRVTAAAGYFKALDILDRSDTELDVLVTDVFLDRGNGFALARIARFNRKHVKAVYVTARDVNLEEAIGPVLRKPVTLDILIATVHEVAGLRQANCA